MIKQAGNVWKRLRRFLTAGPGRFAGGSAVSDPLGLLAGERALLAARRLPQHDGSPRAAAMPDQSIQPGPSGDVTGPMERDRIRRNHRRPCDTAGDGVGADDARGARSRSGSRIMTIAGDGQPRSLGRTATAIQSLSPGYFPFMMATSIISTGTFLLGPSWLSRVPPVIASAGLVALSVALVIRLVLFHPSVAVGFHDPGRVFGFLAIAAGMDVLGLRLAAAGHPLATGT